MRRTRPSRAGSRSRTWLGTVREPSQRRLGDSLSQKTDPSVAAISIVRRFLRPAVTWET